MRRLIWIALVLTAGNTGPLLALTEFVEITSRRANIRSQPRTSSAIVTTARRGDIFFLIDEQGDWYEIHIISGGRRFVHQSLARQVAHTPELPPSIATRRELFESFQEMESRIRREANSQHPPEQRLEKNIRLAQQLRDKYGLEILRRFDVTIPVYRRIRLEGIQSNW